MPQCRRVVKYTHHTHTHTHTHTHISSSRARCCAALPSSLLQAMQQGGDAYTHVLQAAEPGPGDLLAGAGAEPASLDDVGTPVFELFVRRSAAGGQLEQQLAALLPPELTEEQHASMVENLAQAVADDMGESVVSGGHRGSVGLGQRGDWGRWALGPDGVWSSVEVLRWEPGPGNGWRPGQLCGLRPVLDVVVLRWPTWLMLLALGWPPSADCDFSIIPVERGVNEVTGKHFVRININPPGEDLAEASEDDGGGAEVWAEMSGGDLGASGDQAGSDDEDGIATIDDLAAFVLLNTEGEPEGGPEEPEASDSSSSSHAGAPRPGAGSLSDSLQDVVARLQRQQDNFRWAWSGWHGRGRELAWLQEGPGGQGGDGAGLAPTLAPDRGLGIASKTGTNTYPCPATQQHP